MTITLSGCNYLNSHHDEAYIRYNKEKLSERKINECKKIASRSTVSPSSSAQIDAVLKHCELQKLAAQQCGKSDTCKTTVNGRGEKGSNEAEASIMKSCTVVESGHN